MLVSGVRMRPLLWIASKCWTLERGKDAWTALGGKKQQD